MAKFLSQDQITEYKECFSFYDKKHKGKITAGDLITVMRCLGTSPTPPEVQRHLHSHRIDRNGEVDFSTFLAIIHQQQQQEDPAREILEAMTMADTQRNGYITVSELRTKLTCTGERLTDKEVDDLLKETNVSPYGVVRYNQFVNMLMLPSPDY